MRRKIIGIFICMLLIVTTIPVIGQVNDITVNKKNNETSPLLNSDKWMKSFGGNQNDVGSCVQQTSDGGYIIFGETESFGSGSDDVWLVKTDSNGNKIWDKTYGGESIDYANFGEQTNDGGYIIVGNTRSFDIGKSDIWLIKTDETGDMIWDKTFGGEGYENAYEVLQTDDGGYIIIGLTNSFGADDRDIWLIKTDVDGNILWDKTYGGNTDDEGYSVKQTTDGGYILAGKTYTSGTKKLDVWLIKTDNSGEIIWDKTFGGSNDETSSSVQQTTDGGYIICCNKEVGGLNGDDIWIIKTDSNGELLWDKIYGGISSDRGWSIQQTMDGGYVIAGDTFTGPRIDGLLIKTDSNGEKEWSKTYGGHNTDITVHVQQTNDGGYILTGYMQSRMFQYRDLWLIKTDSNGEVPKSKVRNLPFSLFKLFPNLFPILSLLLQRLGLQ